MPIPMYKWGRRRDLDLFLKVVKKISCPDPDPDGKVKMSHRTFVGPEVVYNP